MMEVILPPQGHYIGNIVYYGSDIANIITPEGQLTLHDNCDGTSTWRYEIILR